MLTQSGCGAVFLSAITKTVKFTRSVVGERFMMQLQEYAMVAQLVAPFSLFT